MIFFTSKILLFYILFYSQYQEVKLHLVSENVDTVKAYFVQHKNLPWSMAVSTKRQQTPSCRHISVSTTLPPQPQLTILHSFLLTNVRQKVFLMLLNIFTVSVVADTGLWIIFICFPYAENGIIKDIGQRKLELLLGLIKEETLVFIIDTSPGMSTEVEALDKFIQSVSRSSSPASYKFVLATVGKDGNNPE